MLVGERHHDWVAHNGGRITNEQCDIARKSRNCLLCMRVTLNISFYRCDETSYSLFSRKYVPADALLVQLYFLCSRQFLNLFLFFSIRFFNAVKWGETVSWILIDFLKLPVKYKSAMRRKPIDERIKSCVSKRTRSLYCLLLFN